MSMYTLLENVLYSCDAGRFQKICEYYLLRNFGGEVFMPGGMEDKEKTRTGRPDIYIFLPNKKFILCEATTHDDLDATGYAAKLKKDLQDCLNYEKLKLEHGEIDRIVLATNGTPGLELRKELEAMVKPYQISLEVLGFRKLVGFFYHEGRLYARHHLGIPFPTGQIMDKGEFLRQYGKRQLAAPLDNPIHGRETELEKLTTSISAHQVVVMAGKPGVGKSRLALEAMEGFTKAQPWYQPLYMLTKGGSIAEDLDAFIEPGKFYIVLIDDANRQLESLLPALERSKDVNIHLKFVLTVRDYAQQDINRYLRDYDSEGFVLHRLDDDILQRILYHPPFGVTDNLVRNRIVQVSKGNPRLAIMALQAYSQTQDIAVLDDASKIYEQYFVSVIDDQRVLTDPKTLLVLGMLSFFQSLDSELPETEEILADFGVPMPDYNRIVHLLDELELIEHRFGTVAKIADQVFGTYFFYVCFIEKKYYDAQRLLYRYFDSHTWRVKDTFLPAILAFGPHRVIGKPPRILNNFLNAVSDNREMTEKFLETFSLYVPDHLFAYIADQIKELPVSTEAYQFSNAYKNAQPTIYDGPLRLLEPFYEGTNKYFFDALELAIAYVDKHRSLLDTLLHQLRSHLFVGEEEARDRFKKLTVLYDQLSPRLCDSFPHRVLFYYGMQRAMLADSFPIVVYEKRSDRFTFKPVFAALRERFLADLDQNFERDREYIFDLLIDYLEPGNRQYSAYLEIDQAAFVTLIEKRLSPKRLDDTYFVQEYINLLHDRRVPILTGIQKARRRFINKDYTLIRNLAAERDTRRRNFRDYDDFERTGDRRMAFVKKHIRLCGESDLDRLVRAVEKFRKFKFGHNYHLEAGFGWTLEAVFERDLTLGFNLLSSYLQKGNCVRFNPVRLFNTIFRLGPADTANLFAMISAGDYQDKEDWLDKFYEFYPEIEIPEEVAENLVGHFRKRSSGYDLHLQFFQKYEAVRPGIVSELLGLLYEKRQLDRNFSYKVPYDFFGKYPYLLHHQLPFAKRLYLDLEEINPGFDPGASGLFAIMQHDSGFFTEYLDLRIEKSKAHLPGPRNLLNRVWTFPDADRLVYDMMIKLSTIRLSSITSEDFENALFMHLPDETKPLAINVLSRLLNTYPQDLKKVDIVMGVGRRLLPNDVYEELIRDWLSLNDDPEDFKRVDWTNHAFDYANGLPGNQKIRTYQIVLDAIERMPEPYRYAKHKLYLHQHIEWEQQNVAEELKRMYRGLW